MLNFTNYYDSIYVKSFARNFVTKAKSYIARTKAGIAAGRRAGGSRLQVHEAC